MTQSTIGYGSPMLPAPTLTVPPNIPAGPHRRDLTAELIKADDNIVQDLAAGKLTRRQAAADAQHVSDLFAELHEQPGGDSGEQREVTALGVDHLEQQIAQQASGKQPPHSNRPPHHMTAAQRVYSQLSRVAKALKDGKISQTQAKRLDSQIDAIRSQLGKDCTPAQKWDLSAALDATNQHIKNAIADGPQPPVPIWQGTSDGNHAANPTS